MCAGRTAEACSILQAAVNAGEEPLEQLQQALAQLQAKRLGGASQQPSQPQQLPSSSLAAVPCSTAPRPPPPSTLMLGTPATTQVLALLFAGRKAEEQSTHELGLAVRLTVRLTVRLAVGSWQ